MQNSETQIELPFLKMHGAGNDFVIIDSRGRERVVTADLAAALGDRHRGVGYDQLIEIRDSDLADVAFEFWNSDGSKAGACGNGTRCAASLLIQDETASELSIQTARGILRALQDETGLISVNMGPPQLEWQDIPLASQRDTQHLSIHGDPDAVGMGNPHCIFFVDDAEAVDLEKSGKQIEDHALFPAGTNVEFATVVSPQEIRMCVWERGAGITLACGSGACATLVAAHRRGLTGRKANIIADGGTLVIDWREDGVWMSGPTAHVYSGTLTSSFLRTV